METLELMEKIIEKRKEFLLNKAKKLKIILNKETYIKMHRFFIHNFGVKSEPMMKIYGMDVDLIQNQKEDFIIEEFEDFTDPFEKLIRRLLLMKWGFSVENYINIVEGDPILRFLKEEHVGHCIRYITFVMGNQEVFIHEYETKEIDKILKILENY